MSTAERWILIANCQTQGLANSLQMLAEGVSVEPLDVSQFSQDTRRYNAGFADYQRVLVGRSALEVPSADFSRARRVDEVPEVAFYAYQPDLTYVVADGELLKGPLDVYHSAIAFAAYGRGRSVADTLPLFTRRVYAACGYLDGWTAARDGLVAYCASLRLDVSGAMRRWGRDGAFMYSTNHPRIHVLYDIARLYLAREGYEPLVSDVLPHDNLAHGGVFPVFPEVGEVLGVPGSYLFKRAFEYVQVGLAAYVEECFAVYDRYAPGALHVHEVFGASFARVAAVIGREGETP